VRVRVRVTVRVRVRRGTRRIEKTCCQWIIKTVAALLLEAAVVDYDTDERNLFYEKVQPGDICY
jgi:hypothetical protein